LNNTNTAAMPAPVLKRVRASKLNLLLFMAGVAIVAILPLILPNKFYLRLLNEIMIYGLLAMSLDLLLGYTGLLSFMHNAYLGIGAYATGLLVDPRFPGIPVAGHT
jgi:ABC-type branched-subunit amino acid transport system permease subunit